MTGTPFLRPSPAGSGKVPIAAAAVEEYPAIVGKTELTGRELQPKRE